MTDLTPDEHRAVLANAYLMWRRWLDNPYAPVTAQTAEERPKPPDPRAVHPHMRSWHYDPRTREPRKTVVGR